MSLSARKTDLPHHASHGSRSESLDVPEEYWALESHLGQERAGGFQCLQTSTCVADRGRNTGQGRQVRAAALTMGFLESFVNGS